MRIAWVVGILMMISKPILAEGPVAGAQARTYLSSVDQTEQPYNLYVPTSYRAGSPTPLVVALHGKGATWESWFAALPVEEWAEKEGYLLATPHGRGNWFYLGPGEKDVLEVIEEMEELCTVDRERVYLIGHSMGGFGTWHLAASHPDRFAAIVPMATWAPLDLLPALRHTPVLNIHGAADEVVPLEWGRQADRMMALLGLEHRLVEVPGAGHESKMISDHFDQIGEFLRDRTRVAAPKAVSIRAWTPRRGAAWWVALHDVERLTELASIDAVVSPTRIDVVTDNVLDFAIDPPLDADRLAQPLRLSIDNQHLDVPATNGERIVFLRKLRGEWSARLAERSTFQAPKPKPVGRRPADGVPLPEVVARIVAARMDADAMLLPNDLVAPEIASGPLNEDQLIDLFLRPEDEICRVYLEADDVEAMLAAKDWYPAWWGALTLAPAPPPGRPLVVAVPRILASRMPVAATGTGLSVRRVVYDFVKETGELTVPVPAVDSTPKE